MDIFDKKFLDWIAKNTEDDNKLFYVSGSETNKELTLLEPLFQRVDEYVKSFYYLNVEEYGSIYNISERNNFYTLSMLYGPEIAYSLERDEHKVNYIDLNDVYNNVVRGRENIEVSNRMKAIAFHLRELNKIGVPMDLVEQETSRTIKLIKTKNNR